MPELVPLRDAGELRAYIDANWASGHVLARDPAMFDFTYSTPWVDRTVFPGGYSAIGAYDGDRLVGFIGAAVAPYPRPVSYWLAVWHVLPELKNGGVGAQLLQTLQDIARRANGWIGTFGAGPEAVPVYLSSGYAVRGVRRWRYSPGTGAAVAPPTSPEPEALRERPPEEWLAYRYDRHPVFEYERTANAIFRSEDNDWGHVTHAVWLGDGYEPAVDEVFERERAVAAASGRDYLLDAWAFESPGAGWRLASAALPSVFHPPAPRGNRIFAVGWPTLPLAVQKGDADQDRPN